MRPANSEWFGSFQAVTLIVIAGCLVGCHATGSKEEVPPQVVDALLRAVDEENELKRVLNRPPGLWGWSPSPLARLVADAGPYLIPKLVGRLQGSRDEVTAVLLLLHQALSDPPFRGGEIEAALAESKGARLRGLAARTLAWWERSKALMGYKDLNTTFACMLIDLQYWERYHSFGW